MAIVKELGLMADAVYESKPAVPGWVCTDYHGAAGGLDGFQAAIFERAGEAVIAYRGSSQAMDFVADLKLSSGMNSTYFSDGEKFASRCKNPGVIYVCGHSLGGAIAQVVANRLGFRMVTFNAPGVAVIASRNMGNSTTAGNAIRLAGLALSAVRHPMQAARDVASAFNEVQGLNICLEYDAVSRIGNHYGRVLRIQGTSMNPLTEHKMGTMNSVLATNPIGQQTVSAL